ncbi:helix-turn-helix transcriptional regulator [Chitinophaga filiformis]|uniref:Helix-turn-helix transcriptional regulator n=1 Tax=Chitinophaga filiformis TaxID=104663 RepID=A0ABY4HWL5_CHIFI|nr:helix-turn-helix transcriptional regulator [Chitinophaga filiformis]UPK67843.1 helix-turn-helix transcriptional regulator [Chitinophaga filiformis]
MNYYTIAPPVKLAEYVQFFWVLEGSATPVNPFFHRVMAESSPEWIFYCKGQFESPEGQRTPLSCLSGQLQDFKKLYTSNDFCLFGIYLFPYAIPGIFGLPAHALSDQTVDTGTLLGREGQLLEQKIFAAADHMQRATIISQFILQRLAKSRETDSAVFTSIRQILFSSAALSIPALADSCCLSRRQFERRFVHYAGYSPKHFQRIARFNAVIKGFDKRPGSLTEMAYNCGYYDQSHFIHDFRLFSGYNPKAFFKNQKDAIDYRAFEEFNSWSED